MQILNLNQTNIIVYDQEKVSNVLRGIDFHEGHAILTYKECMLSDVKGKWVLAVHSEKVSLRKIKPGKGLMKQKI